jgi:hypothetical protein
MLSSKSIGTIHSFVSASHLPPAFLISSLTSYVFLLGMRRVSAVCVGAVCVRAFEIRDVRVGNDVLDTAGFGVSGDISVLSGRAGLHTGACEVNGSRGFKSALGGKIHAFTAGFQVPPRDLIFSLWMNVSPVTTVDPSVRFVKTRGILNMSIKTTQYL